MLFSCGMPFSVLAFQMDLRGYSSGNYSSSSTKLILITRNEISKCAIARKNRWKQLSRPTCSEIAQDTENHKLYSFYTIPYV